MKKLNATRELTTGEQQQIVKQQAKHRYYSRKLDKQRDNGEQRFRPIVKQREDTADDDLAGIDLRRVKYLVDLSDLDYSS